MRVNKPSTDKILKALVPLKSVLEFASTIVKMTDFLMP